jgi:adenylosuccinate synthase
MPVTAIVGANWGDEGKGKMCDCMAARSDYVVRYQGGNNAGHTVINGYGKFALHLLPSGVFFPHVVNVLGPGVALNVEALLREYEELVAQGVPVPHLRISDRAQVVLPYHSLLDACEEERLGMQAFGSTRCGIAPFYADKCLKVGIQTGDLSNRSMVRSQLEKALAAKNALLEHLYGKPSIQVEPLIEELSSCADRIAPFLCDTTRLLNDAVRTGKNVLLEGQLGALRDIDHGIYPFSTSSPPLAGYASVGAGIAPYEIRRIIAVVKAYSTCVGAGPFVTELADAEAQELRERGGDAGEYGATTGRPRRVGWFDAVATRYGCRLQGATEAAVSLLDVLGYLKEIPIATAYDIDGRQTSDFPRTSVLERAKPVHETMTGWLCSIGTVRRFADLPETAQAYVRRLEELIEVPVRWVSVGPRREQLIER